ncbi:MAG: hypothetical protein IGS50_06930 [Synechococcales cyanobacterium C42_A2020_086]|nr:hypothetical protein [Synechococcales cyanobacterium C42_A2020_086]
MTLTELDQLLLDWQRKLELASQNLLDLQNLPTYQRLAGEGGFTKAPLTGATAKAVEPALKAMDDLFQHFALLAQTIERALFLRRQINTIWGTDPRIDNIVQILTQKSVQLSVVSLPLSQRGLLSEAEQGYYVTPSSLLAAMQSAFDLARDQVLAVDHAWATLEAKLLDATSAIQELEAEGATLDAAKTTLSALQDRILSDPLGVQEEFETTVAPLIDQARQRLNEEKHRQQTLEAELALARQQLQNLQAMVHQATSLGAETAEKIQEPPEPLPEVNLTALEQWLSRLETKCAEGAIGPTQVGLRNWRRQVEQAMTTTQMTLAAHTQVLQHRQELRGRLEALQAKALARGVAEDITLVQAAAQAHQLLYSRPTDLKQAADWVSRYERWLNQGC